MFLASGPVGAAEFRPLFISGIGSDWTVVRIEESQEFCIAGYKPAPCAVVIPRRGRAAELDIVKFSGVQAARETRAPVVAGQDGSQGEVQERIRLGLGDFVDLLQFKAGLPRRNDIAMVPADPPTGGRKHGVGLWECRRRGEVGGDELLPSGGTG